MNFPGRVHVHEGDLTARVVVIISVVVIAIAALIWNVYVSITGPLPVAEQVAPSRSSTSETSKSLIDMVGRDAGRLAHGEILARPGEKSLEAPAKEMVAPREKQPIVVRPPVSDNYYEKTDDVRR